MQKQTSMRIILIAFFSVIAGFGLHAEKTTIELTVLAEEPLAATFTPTLDGFYFAGAAQMVTVNPGRKLSFSFDSERPGLSYISFGEWAFPGTGGDIVVYTEPGDAVQIAFSKSDPVKTLRITGSQRAVNQHLAKTKRPVVTKTYMDNFWLDEPSAAILGRQLEISMKKEWVNLFSGPLKKHPAFPYLEAESFWWHMRILHDLATNHMAKHDSRLPEWESVFLTVAGREPEVPYSRATMWFSEAMYSLIEGYRSDLFKMANGLPVDTTVAIEPIVSTLDYEHWQQAALEKYLNEAIGVEPFAAVQPLFERLVTRHPRSPALPYLRRRMEPLIAFERYYDPADSSAIYQPQPANWQELADSLAGKVAYLYVWRSDKTQCLSCREQMQAVWTLQRQFPDDFVVLMLSLDEPEDWSRWHREFYFREWARADHLLVRGALRQDVLNRLGSMGELPRALILGRDGQLITNAGPLPTDPVAWTGYMRALFQNPESPDN